MSQNRLQLTRTFTVHVPQLVGRVSYPQYTELAEGGDGIHRALRRLVGEYDTAMAELQNFLKYLQTAADEVVTEGGFYPGVPEIVDATLGDTGDPTLGWSPGPHRHQVRVGNPVGLGNANAPGAGPALALNDHVHKRDIRVKFEGVDIGTRNAANYHDTGDIVWAISDDVVNDEIDIEASAGPALESRIQSTALFMGMLLRRPA